MQIQPHPAPQRSALVLPTRQHTVQGASGCRASGPPPELSPCHTHTSSKGSPMVSGTQNLFE